MSSPSSSKNSNKSHKCKFCGDENIDNFSEGRYSTCKSCRKEKNSEYQRLKRHDIKNKENSENKISFGIINNYVANERIYKFGYSTIEESIVNLNQRLDIIEKKNEEFMEKVNYLIQLFEKEDYNLHNKPKNKF